jgi:hypothetical protein
MESRLLANPELREWACVGAFEEAMARLFEGMVLMPLGCDARVKGWPQGLGEVVSFSVVAVSSRTELLVDRNPDSNGPGHVWGDPVIPLDSADHQPRFVRFFDWYQRAPRDFRLLEVLIERLDQRPELVLVRRRPENAAAPSPPIKHPHANQSP